MPGSVGCAPAAWAPLQILLVAQVGGEQLSVGVEERDQRMLKTWDG